MQDTVTILGIPFSKLTLHETIADLSEHLHSKTARMLHLITVNPEIAIASQTDMLLQRIIGEADLITPDGIGIVLASRRQGEPIPERVTGYDLLLGLLEAGNRACWSFYFLGTDELTNRQAAEAIGVRYPNVRLAGRHHGYFSQDEAPSIVSHIRQARPDVLVVAMGAPYSDKWIYKHKQELAQTKLVFGVGGSLDVIAGKVKAAPAIWKRLNLEWLHRLLSVPAAKGQKSRWRRQAALPKFLYRAIIRNPKL